MLSYHSFIDSVNIQWMDKLGMHKFIIQQSILDGLVTLLGECGQPKKETKNVGYIQPTNAHDPFH